MLTIPGLPQPQSNGDRSRAQGDATSPMLPDETSLLMAAAEQHRIGRLIEPQERIAMMPRDLETGAAMAQSMSRQAFRPNFGGGGAKQAQPGDSPPAKEPRSLFKLRSSPRSRPLDT